MIGLIILTISIAYVVNFYRTTRKYPKGPLPVPIFGNVFQLTPNALHHDLERFREKYGNVFTLWLLNRPMIVLLKAEDIREALVTKAGQFDDRTNEFPETIFQTVDNGGVLFASGESWRVQRRNAMHILRNFGVGKNVMEQQIIEQVAQFCENVSSSDMSRIELQFPIQALVGNIINKLLYGFCYKFEECEPLVNYTNRLNAISLEMAKNPLILFPMLMPSMKNWPVIGSKACGKHVKDYAWCLNFVKKDIEQAAHGYKADADPSCFVQAYLQLMEKNPDLTKPQLTNVCSDFFMAGMETTTTTLRWAVLYLTKYQEIQGKLRKEIESVIGFDRFPSLADRVQMPYTLAFLNELQRCSNILALNIVRKASQDSTIADHPIAAGTRILISIYTALREPQIFPDPDTFKPERFLKEDGSFDQEMNSRMIAFSMGKRQCAGESLARAELFLSITSFVQKFKFYPAEDWTLDMEPILGPTQLPKTNFLRLEHVH